MWLGAILLWLASFAGIAYQPRAEPSDVVQSHAEGDINWTRHLWRVSGKSPPVSPALSVGGPIQQVGGALVLAHADSVQHVQALVRRMLEGQRASGQVMGPITSAQMQRVVKSLGAGSAPETEFFADGHVVWTQEFAWDGPLAEILATARVAARLRPQAVLRPKAGTPVMPTSVPVHPTGLVVNARGLRVHPCLLLELCDGVGRVLYDIRSVTSNALAAFGVVRYQHSLDQAIRDEHLGGHPAVVRARALGAGASCALVLEDADAATVAAAFVALQQGRVIVVLD